MTVSSSSNVFKDGSDLVSLSRVASVLNEFFQLDTTVQYDTPFVWWDRSKSNHGISLPMPEPMAYVGGSANDPARARGPLWRQDQILHWYGEWQGLDVPEGRSAGDRIDSRGRFTPSTYRKVVADVD